MTTVEPFDEGKLKAGIDLLGRTGAKTFQIRYCEEEQPIVWMAVAEYGDTWEAAAGRDPVTAVSRLCSRIIDGGLCLHCQKPSGLSEDPLIDAVEDAVRPLICWYKYDPELGTYRRSCEGTT